MDDSFGIDKGVSVTYNVHTFIAEETLTKYDVVGLGTASGQVSKPKTINSTIIGTVVDDSVSEGQEVSIACIAPVLKCKAFAQITYVYGSVNYPAGVYVGVSAGGAGTVIAVAPSIGSTPGAQFMTGVIGIALESAAAGDIFRVLAIGSAGIVPDA